MEDLHLAVAAGSGADADGRDGELLGDERGELRGDALEHDRERARVLERAAVVEQLQRAARSRFACTL